MSGHDDPKIIQLGAPLPPGDYLTRENAQALVGAVVRDHDRPHRVGQVVGYAGFSFPDPADPSQRRTVWAANLVVVDAKNLELSAERMHTVAASFRDRWQVLEGADRQAAVTAFDAHFERRQQEQRVAPSLRPGRRP